MFMSSSGALHNLSHVDVPYCYLTFSELSVNFGNTLQLFRYLFFFDLIHHISLLTFPPCCSEFSFPCWPVKCSCDFWNGTLSAFRTSQNYFDDCRLFCVGATIWFSQHGEEVPIGLWDVRKGNLTDVFPFPYSLSLHL